MHIQLGIEFTKVWYVDGKGGSAQGRILSHGGGSILISVKTMKHQILNTPIGKYQAGYDNRFPYRRRVR